MKTESMISFPAVADPRDALRWFASLSFVSKRKWSPELREALSDFIDAVLWEPGCKANAKTSRYWRMVDAGIALLSNTKEMMDEAWRTLDSWSDQDRVESLPAVIRRLRKFADELEEVLREAQQ